MKKKFRIKTFGCQMNVHDSEKIAGIFADSGYEESEKGRRPDVIVLNTCSIREKAEQKFYSDLGRLKSAKRDNPELKIAVAGCIAQQAGEKIMKKFPHVDYIFGPNNIDKLQNWIDGNSSKSSIEDNPLYHTQDLPMKREGGVKAWVSIMYGCDNFCAYCIVPYTRGRERSRPHEQIISEVNNVVEAGCKEITLLGQNVNSYGKGMQDNVNFPALLQRIHDSTSIERIRFVTSHPKDLSDELIEVMRAFPRVCEHMHLPLQAGSDKVLALMNRAYTYQEYKDKVEKLRDAIPGVAVTSDIIAGFPGETDDDFRFTMKALEEIRFDGIFSFKYSKRPGTRALDLPDHIDEEVKSERLSEILRLQEVVSAQKNKEIEGDIVEILVEGCSGADTEKLTGRTRTNKIVNYSGDKSDVGKLIKVRILESRQYSLNGEKL